MTKFALGIHHLNMAYVAGDYPSYHRQVRESVIPLLDMLERHPPWSFNIEMSGYSIEFIAKHYPFVLDRFRRMIYDGQIELISAEYAPRIWIAFPRRDMIKSIEINQKLLKDLDLPVSRIFFTQENFFGPGAQTLTEWFDSAVVKDDYYFYLHEPPEQGENVPPYYALDDIKLLIGWGHIMEEIAVRVFPDMPCNSKRAGTERQKSGCFFKRWQKAKEAAVAVKVEHNIRSHVRPEYAHWSPQWLNFLYHARQQKYLGGKLTFFRSRLKDLEWTWYHIGSSERFSKPATFPGDVKNYHVEPEWLRVAESCLERYEAEGFRITTVGDFVAAIDKLDFKAPPCKPLLDGCWNMSTAKGGFVWMGENNAAHEDCLAVRELNWKSRQRLVSLEDSLDKLSWDAGGEKPNNRLERVWKNQLLAEVSDATGWFPTPGEVWFSIIHSERVLNLCSKIEAYYGKAMAMTSEIIAEPLEPEKCHAGPIEFIAGGGAAWLFQQDENSQRLEIMFTPVEKSGGIAFPLAESLSITTAFNNQQPFRINMQTFMPNQLFLMSDEPLYIRNDVSLVKLKPKGTGCFIDWQRRRIAYMISDARQNSIRYCFLLCRCRYVAGNHNDEKTECDSPAGYSGIFEQKIISTTKRTRERTNV